MRYPVVTLCGSTRFKDEFEKIQKELTLDGYIVLSVGLFGHSGDNEVWEQMDEGTKTSTKMMLDDMHKVKIDMADRIFVVNPEGYIGESTWSEICYAYMLGKHIDSLEAISPRDIEELAEEHIQKAELYAKQQLDGAAHHGFYNDSNYVFFRHKGKDVLDPWIREDNQGDMWAWEQHGNKEIAIDPFKYYGKKKIARFVENIVMRRG